MPNLICDTSTIQYLHQLNLLHILPALAEDVFLPSAVSEELSIGREAGVNLPDITELDWVKIKIPISVSALPLINDLGSGEAEVLVLALEMKNCVMVLDDALARRIAEMLNLPFTGTLGVLLDAKKAKLITEIKPYLNQLDALGFHLSRETRSVILKIADERV